MRRESGDVIDERHARDESEPRETERHERERDKRERDKREREREPRCNRRERIDERANENSDE